MQFDLVTAIAQAVNFLVLMVVLKKLLYKPMLNAIEKRKDDLKQKADEASVRLAEVDLLKEEYELKLQNIEKEKQKLLAEVVDEVAKEKEKLHLEVLRENEEARTKLAMEIAESKDKVINESVKVIASSFHAFASNVLSTIANTNLEKGVADSFSKQILNLSNESISKIKVACMQNKQLVIQSSFAFSEDSTKLITSAIHDVIPESKEIEFKVDEKLIIGAVLIIGSLIISWSAKEALDDFKLQLINILR